MTSLKITIILFYIVIFITGISVLSISYNVNDGGTVDIGKNLTLGTLKILFYLNNL